VAIRFWFIYYEKQRKAKRIYDNYKKGIVMNKEDRKDYNENIIRIRKTKTYRISNKSSRK